jgi:hypothetical protein
VFVGFGQGRGLASLCREKGFATTYTEYAGLGHDVTPEVLRGLRRFLQERMPRVAPADVRFGLGVCGLGFRVVGVRFRV